MTEIERILDQLKRAYEGNAWYGPSLREVLAGITAEQARALHGVIQHDLYHAGQIAMLKNALS